MLKKPWDKIRADYESGDMIADDVAMKWSIKAGTLRARASRENWATPNRFKKAMGDMVALVQGSSEFKEELARLSQPEVAGSEGHKMQPAVTLPREPGAYQALVAEMAMRAVCNGITKVKRPTNWREIATADTIARRALGLDSKNGGGAAAMVRVTGPNGFQVDVATGTNTGEGVPAYDEDEDYGD
jgi:hypothetical protein